MQWSGWFLCPHESGNLGFLKYNLPGWKNANNQYASDDRGMLTYTDLVKGFEFGPWTVVPERDLIRNGDEERHLEPLVMNVFVVLASHGGGVVTRDQLVEAVWEGRPQADEVITRCISALRRSLGDNAREPVYIETLQKRGYRVMQRVCLPDATEPERAASLAIRPWHVAALALAVVVIVGLSQLVGERSPTLVDTPIRSVAVYPFDCKQDAANPSEHLCYGFAEEAISGLKRLADLQVIRMRRPFDGKTPQGVHGIVTGSVQIIGDQVRIAAFLEDTRSGLAVCCDTFDATSRTIFDAQKRVAGALSDSIDGNGQEIAATAAPATSFEVETAYSLGRFLFEKRDAASNTNAVRQFEKAIALDPGYGPAWLGLAFTYINWPDYDLGIDRDAMYDKALQVIEEGVAADPGIREAAETVYGFVLHRRNDWLAAAQAFEMAIAAPIEQPTAYHLYSFFMASVGRMELALQHAVHALQMDPDNPSIITRAAIIALYRNDPDSASRYFEMASQYGFENYAHSLARALLMYRQGRFDEAKASGRKGLELSSVDDASWFDLIIDGGHDEAVRPQAVQMLSQVSSMNVLPANLEMFFWMLLGEVERAMSIARRLESEPGLYELELVFTDEFRPMRAHPEFADFFASIGLTEYWERAGCAWSDDNLRCR